ncbi:MAG: hypothetical protein EB015_17630, partial [Methylocystaceae bacterium]|nr:hypothetical protein [Methylocystaceae bacterium]
VAELSIVIPNSKVFAQLREHPAAELQNLSEKAEKLQVLQSRLEDATIHQERDQIIACIAGAIMAGLVAGIVLGALFCPEVALASYITLTFFGFACSVVAASAAEEDHRDGYQMEKFADMFFVGIPTLMSHFLSRKSALQNKVNPLQEEVKNKLLAAGRYLQDHIPAIRAKLENDIQNAQTVLVQARNLALEGSLGDLNSTLDHSRDLLAELNNKGQPMLDRMIQAGILDRD